MAVYQAPGRYSVFLWGASSFEHVELACKSARFECENSDCIYSERSVIGWSVMGCNRPASRAFLSLTEDRPADGRLFNIQPPTSNY